MRVALRPIGDIGADADVLPRLARDIGEVFSLDAEVGDSLPLSQHAFNSSRRQYSATWLLSYLRSVSAPPATAVLGVTAEDLYAEGLNFVFGQAEMPGRCAVISLHRLRPGRGETNDELFYRRALKEAVHEIGHTLGLGHCPDPLCVMHFSNTIADTDHKAAGLCSLCQARL